LYAIAAARGAEELAGEEDIVCLSVVPSDGVCKPKDLSAGHASRNVRRWKEALGRAGVTWFIGALDYSANEHADDLYERHWSEHFFGFTSTSDLAGLKKKLREQFPATDAIPRPIKIQPWDGNEKALLYLFKPNAWRRVATDDGERFEKKRGHMRPPCRATDKQRLTSKQRVRLALHLDGIGFQGRMVLRWAQFINLDGTNPIIVSRAPKRRSHELTPSDGLGVPSK
jgi:hypothetical protein